MTVKVSRFFRPSLAATVALGLLVTLFTGLGVWQAKRAVEKSTLEQLHQQAAAVTLQTALEGDQRFARIDANGHYDLHRHILLDNQIWQSRAGVHVFTPFYTLEGTTILVNRGWLPLAADRGSLPDIPTPRHELVLRGRLNILPVPGRVIGQPDSLNDELWPQLVTYLSVKDISTALGVSLQERVIQLSAQEQHGFEGRDWKAVFLSSKRHKGYAFQWFALATAAMVLWLLNGFSNPRGNKR